MQKRVLHVALAVFVLGWLSLPALSAEDAPSPAEADRPQASDQKKKQDEEKGKRDGAAGLAARWLERMRNLGRTSPNEKAHEKVKAAFREVVADAGESTVRIVAGDKPKALGTVISADGYILTKASELEEEEIVCLLRDGRRLSATLVGVHDDHDLAMLQVEADDLTPIQFREKAKLTLGSLLATPGPDDDVVAYGVVSATTRRVRPAPPVLGIQLDESDDGPKIVKVFPKSGAQEAGLKKGDFVLSVDGKRTKNRQALIRQIRKRKVGDLVKIKVKRDDEELELSAELGRPSSVLGFQTDAQKRIGGSLSARRSGFSKAIQHDTVLRPFDCGGPVVDLSGQAVGVNIARAGRVVSYALPASEVLSVVEELRSGKLAPPVEPSNLERLAKLERRIAEFTAELNRHVAGQAQARKLLQEKQAAVERAQKERDAAAEQLQAADNAVTDTEAALEQLKAQLSELKAE